MDRRTCPRRAIALLTVVLAAALLAGARRDVRAAAAPHELQFVFTSDQHYGITRPAFRGRSDVDAHTVNAAMVAKINSLPGVAFPEDGGLRAGHRIGAIDFVLDGGDIANREEVTAGGPHPERRGSRGPSTGRTTSKASRLTDHAGHRAALYVVPGNHDVTNAIGFYRPMRPATDDSSMVAIYNLMMRPAVPLTDATYRYRTDRVATFRDIAGIHFVFLTVWPDSQMRAWMDRDLARVSRSTPVVIVTHDEPDAESKHFINPNGSARHQRPGQVREPALGHAGRRPEHEDARTSSSSGRWSSSSTVIRTSRPTSTATRTGTSSTTGPGRTIRPTFTPSGSIRR